MSRLTNRHFRSVMPPPAPLSWVRQTLVIEIPSRFNGQPIDLPLHLRRVLKCLLRGFGVRVLEVRDGGEVGKTTGRDYAYDVNQAGDVRGGVA